MKCEACDGAGVIIITYWTFDGDSDRQYPLYEEEETCEECSGLGVINNAS